MTRAVGIEALSAAVLRGLKAAHKQHSDLSGLESLVNAPESFVVTCIAQVLGKTAGQGYVTLEDSVRGIMKNSSASHVGRPKKVLRQNGRYDLVLWWATKGGSTPRAVVEVKHPVYSAKTIFNDAKRICASLSNSAKTKQGTLQFGAMAFWTGHERTKIRAKDRDPKETVNKRIQAIADSIAKEIGPDFTVRVERHSKSEDGGDWAWGVAVLIIRYKSQHSDTIG